MLTKNISDYFISPRIFPIGQTSTFAIYPQGSHAQFKDSEYTVQILPKYGSKEPKNDYHQEDFQVGEDGILRIAYCFPDEQEYFIRLYPKSASLVPQNAVNTFRVYALEADLFQRRPYKGDFHSHSCYSDGREEPAIVAANYRKAGFDFLALTDHQQYQPSQKLKADYKNIPTDLLLLSGEEVHPFQNHIHMLSIGGSFSINEKIQQDPAAYQEEVEKLSNDLAIPAGIDPFTYASCIWTFCQIKKAQGLSIFCHPHWLADVFHVPDAMSRALFASKEFDAFELLGGQEVFSNNLQLEFYAQELAQGNGCPVVGVSDSHGTVEGQWFTWTYSVIFAQEVSEEAIVSAVKNNYSVAVEHYPGEEYRVHGPYRLVCYARFLLDCYFPLQAELCFEEGRLMKEAYLGSERARKFLGQLQGRCQELVESYFTSRGE